MANKNCGIYALAEADDGTIRYVGQSVDIKTRYQSHMSGAGGADYPVQRWVKKRLKQRKKPILIVLENCDRAYLDEKEEKAIAFYGLENLYNVSPGGKPSYDKLTAKKPWVGSSVSCPSRLYATTMHSRTGSTCGWRAVKQDVNKCKTEKDRMLLEIRYANMIVDTDLRDKAMQWAREVYPMVKAMGIAP